MLLKSGVALAALTPVVPLYVKNAFAASSGQLNVLMWGEYLPDSVVSDFKAKQASPSTTQKLVTTVKSFRR